MWIHITEKSLKYDNDIMMMIIVIILNNSFKLISIITEKL